MKLVLDNSTIAAISTSPGIGAIGVIRMSGIHAKEILKKVWISANISVDKFETHRLYYGKISTIDNVLAVWMKAPHSYTGEDVVEISCHGGTVSTKAVLEAVIEAGARPATPGEFTRRAFLNGKMDLSQAEGVADIINATNERAARLAREQLEGTLSKKVKEIQSKLKETKAFIEATIDFSEGDIGFIKKDGVELNIKDICKCLQNLASTLDEGRMIHDGVRVVIVGRPNVGKSSLLNALLGSERAIVHHAPGTTRDLIEDMVNIGGVTFRLIDTAGIRDSTCEIEQMGIKRTRMRLSEADLAIVIFDATFICDDDFKLLDEIGDSPKVIVINKIDLLSAGVARRAFEHLPKTGAQRTHSDRTPADQIKLSAKTGEGIDILKDHMIRFVSSRSSSEGVVITNIRHKKAIDRSIEFINSASKAISEGESAEFIAHHIGMAMDSLGEITGEVTTEDILDEIFSKFCIGK